MKRGLQREVKVLYVAFNGPKRNNLTLDLQAVGCIVRNNQNYSYDYFFLLRKMQPNFAFVSRKKYSANSISIWLQERTIFSRKILHHHKQMRHFNFNPSIDEIFRQNALTIISCPNKNVEKMIKEMQIGIDVLCLPRLCTSQGVETIV